MTGKSAIGLIGLGTMGASLALNIAEKGFPIAVFNRTAAKTDAFFKDAGKLAKNITPSQTLAEFVAAIKPPRAMIVMIDAGPAVDSQIALLRPLLAKGDLVIDCGNANFNDTNRRAAELVSAGFAYLGVGVSGGEEGARHGPSIMGGGSKAAWQRVEPVFSAIAAKYEGAPCSALMGPEGAGHFVKTVHNGIEYADMQMIAEIYGIMRDGMGMNAKSIGEVFARWNEGPLKSYLVEISANVATAVDTVTGRPMLDVILDRAGQKGTGRWTAIEAQHLAAPVSAIEAAVAARNLSSRLEQRRAGEKLFGSAPVKLRSGDVTLGELEHALMAGKIICYAQGFGLTAAASQAFGWSLPLPEIARVWRNGCIIRSAMLNDMAGALEKNPSGDLMHADYFAGILRQSHGDLRKLVGLTAVNGLPAPALAAALSHFDMMRTARSTANMIQAQRDFFGAHSFERIDKPGAHHGPWGSGHGHSHG